MNNQNGFAESGNSPPSSQQDALPVRQGANLIRRGTPNILEELFEMQNRICDLCGHPIQDLICAALDHSTPVLFFARSDMPLGEAIAQANDPKNLRCVHASCNLAKGRRTREEWFAQGLNNRVAPRLLTDGELLLLAFQKGAGGRIAGRKHAENKTGVCGRSPEKMAADSRVSGLKHKERGTGIFAPGASAKGGRVSGRQNVKSGHIQALGRISGRKHVESGHIQALGRIMGRKAVESGHLARIGHLGGRKCAENKTGVCGQSPEKLAANGRKGGHRTKERGTGIFAPEYRGEGGRTGAPIANHNRWHRDRGISNPNCELCQVVSVPANISKRDAQALIGRAAAKSRSQVA